MSFFVPLLAVPHKIAASSLRSRGATFQWREGFRSSPVATKRHNDGVVKVGARMGSHL